jgi:hypothetical protein
MAERGPKVIAAIMQPQTMISQGMGRVAVGCRKAGSGFQDALQ